MRSLISVIFAFCVVNCQNFGYPESPGQRLDSKPTNKDNRVPLFVPGRCGENELLYPGDQKHDWICDCGPTYIYYPPKNGCFPAYKQGPCKKGEHLILKKEEVIPECVLNPCPEGSALFKRQCYELGKSGGPCRPINAGGGIFDVNATTLEVECLIGTDKLSLFTMRPSKCPPGSRRDHNRECQEVYNS